MRLPLVLLALIALGAGASAFAKTGGEKQQEPEITAASVLRLTSAQGCVSPSRITVRAVPPAGVELELLDLYDEHLAPPPPGRRFPVSGRFLLAALNVARTPDVALPPRPSAPHPTREAAER